MMKKLGFLKNSYTFIVEDKGLHPDTHQKYYDIYSSGASGWYFVLMIPILGNLMACVSWIISLTDKRYVEIDNKNYGKIVCSSEKK